MNMDRVQVDEPSDTAERVLAVDALRRGCALRSASVPAAILDAAAHAPDGLSAAALDSLPRSLDYLLRLGHLTRVTLFDRPDRFYITDAGILALDAAYSAAND